MVLLERGYRHRLHLLGKSTTSYIAVRNMAFTVLIQLSYFPRLDFDRRSHAHWINMST